MWLFTTIGFFSIVQKPGTDFLTVRSRVREDLDNLRERYLPDLSPTIDHAGTDYPYRATVPHAAFASALEKIALDIDYGNYKDEVAARQGSARSHVYGAVWETLFGLSKSKGVRKPRLADLGSKSATAGQALAYGGVVFDPAGLVLLREPKGHYDGYVWTFSKGRPRRGESPEAAALRETLEETGVHARIVSPIPGEFAGGTTVNCYFVMEADAGSGGVAADDKETASICWVAPDEARRRIGLTTNPVGRKRDLDVLAAGLKTRSRGSPPNEDPASKDPDSKIPPKAFWNTCIADDSGIARRLCIAIGAFRAQHGAWPSRLIAGTLTDRLLREQLTAEGYAVLQQRLPIALGKRDALVVRDETGRDYDYNADHLFTLETPLGEVTMWLWGCRPPDPWGG